MQQDMTGTAEIHARLAAKGLLPAEHFVDAAYVDAALLVGSRRDHGVLLEGPVAWGSSTDPVRSSLNRDPPQTS